MTQSYHWKDEKNMALLFDFYEATMTNGYLFNGDGHAKVYFDYFFRRVPDNGGFAITAGLEQFIRYLLEMKFSEEDIETFKEKNLFCDAFIDFLRDFKFTGDVWAIPEGTPVFPNTPIVTIGASILEAQMIETFLEISLNHQSLIATKANRIVRVANGKPVVDFGARRAHGGDASIYGARASYIAGCQGTSNYLAHKMFDIPVVGTMAHSWVQFYGSDKLAFEKYQNAYPDKSIFLVDTFNTLKSGVPAAIKVFDKMEKDALKGIRIDSGDLSYLSKEARKMLDEAGHQDAIITVSNALDEYKIRELEALGAPINSYGVGERMITARSESVFGGVYKLVAVEVDGVLDPRIKISEDDIKITNPGLKEVWRLYDNQSGKAFADLLTLKDEMVEAPYKLFDEFMPWKNKTFKDFTAKKLQVQVLKEGKLVYELPTIEDIRLHCEKEIKTLWDGLLKVQSPDKYFVNLSFDLWASKRQLIEEAVIDINEQIEHLNINA